MKGWEDARTAVNVNIRSNMMIVIWSCVCLPVCRNPICYRLCKTIALQERRPPSLVVRDCANTTRKCCLEATQAIDKSKSLRKLYRIPHILYVRESSTPVLSLICTDRFYSMGYCTVILFPRFLFVSLCDVMRLFIQCTQPNI